MKKQPAPAIPAKKRAEKAAGRKEVQKKQDASQKKEQALDWEAVFRAIGSPAMIVAPDHTIRSTNDATCRITGKTEAALQGMKCWEVFHRHDATHPPQGCPMVRLLSSGKHETAEMEVAMNGGVYLVSCTPVVDANGAISSILHIATNITDRKKTERMVHENEERYRNIIADTEAGYFQIDTEGRFTRVNPAWLRMHGFSSETEVIGKHFSITQVDTDQRAAQKSVEYLLGGGKIPHGEFSRKMKDGSIGYHTFSASPIVKNGEVAGMEGFLIDITESKLAEDALKESVKDYHDLYHNAAVGIFHSSFEGRFLDVNPSLAKMLGYASPEEAIMSVTNMAEQVYAEPPRYDAVTTAVLNSGGIFRTENRYRRRDGTLWYGMLHVRIVPDQQGRPSHYEGFVEDITDRKRAEDALRKSEEKFGNYSTGQTTRLCCIPLRQRNRRASSTLTRSRAVCLDIAGKSCHEMAPSRFLLNFHV